MTEKTKQVHFEWDQSEFNKNAEKLIEDAKVQVLPILKRLISSYVASAATNTPPNIGRRNIQKKYYQTVILGLGKLIRRRYKDYKPTKEDYQAHHKGFGFKVVSTKAKKPNKTIGYYKSLSAAKKAAKIQTRGLARWSWGADLNSVGIPLPSIFTSLQTKSPALSNKKFSKIQIKQQGSQTYAQITNNTNFMSSSALAFAMAKADKRTELVLQKQLEKLVKSIDKEI